jgi:energy-coupling factor transporter ATP-binding protein EcfA2
VTTVNTTANAATQSTSDGPGADLDRRFAALGHFLRVVSPHVAGATAPIDASAVPAAQNLVDRARVRLDLGAREHTVVALAGATGSGKSSLFNALAGMELSPAGVLRPTTDEAHACVWGDGDADALLDWLRVAPTQRFRRESALDAEDQAALRGVVLLDLPDLDSIATGHRIEASRLVGAVDLVIWVLDPQKYADASVHDGYLRHMGSLRDVTAVVFNQTDRLLPSDVERCLADVRRLLDADGLVGVPVLGVSAATGAGVAEVRAVLERAVAGRPAAAARLAGELDHTIAALAPLVTEASDGSGVPGEPPETPSPESVRELSDGFAEAAGVSAIAAEAGRYYRRRAAVPGPPFRRRTGFRPHRSAQEVPAADPAAVGSAVRRLAAVSSTGLPAPWPDEVRAAAAGGADWIPEELGRAVREASPRGPRAVGWLVARVVWWLAVAAVLVGAGWLAWSRFGTAPERTTLAVSLVVAGGILAIALPLLALSLAVARARRWRRRVERRLTGAAATVARESVAPVRAVLRDYAEARSAFSAASRP